MTLLFKKLLPFFASLALSALADDSNVPAPAGGTVSATPAVPATSATVATEAGAPVKVQSPAPSAPIGPTLNPRLKTLWTNCEHCAQPESAYYSPTSGAIFISNVDGAPATKDSKGSIQKVSVDGKMLNGAFVTGLNAPKGIRSYNGKLFVADIDKLLIINEKSGKIEKKVPVPGAQFLNDVAIDKKGTVYISDTTGSAIYSWSPREGVKSLVSGKYLECPNGLSVDGKTLYIAAWGVMEPDWSTKVPGRLLAMDLKSLEVTVVTKEPLGNLDGLEILDSDHFLISDWVKGKVFSVSRKGEVEELLSGVTGAADLGWIASKKILLLPRMGDNLISAYSLQ